MSAKVESIERLLFSFNGHHRKDYMEVNINDRQLNEFLEREWDRGMLFLGACFDSLSMVEREDIVQDSMIALANNIRSGKYEQQDATLHTYFIAICRNQALKRTSRIGTFVPLRDEKKQPDNSDFDLSDSLNYLTEHKEHYIREHIVTLIDLFEDSQEAREKKIEAVQTTVKNLTGKCQTLIWGKYRDRLSMTVLAEMTGLKNANVAKTSLSRCLDAFEKEFKKLTTL